MPQVVKRKFKLSNSDFSFDNFSYDKVEKECIVVKIDGEEYEECERASENFWASSKKGAYGEGLASTKKDKRLAERTGCLGQMAFGKLTGLLVDTTYRRGGDSQDVLIGKYRVDIKTATYDYGAVLAYHTNEWGEKQLVDKDIYVGAYIEKECRTNKIAIVVMTGFALKEDVERCEVAVGKKGNGHLNYVIPFDTLRPITKLINLINLYTK